MGEWISVEDRAPSKEYDGVAVIVAVLTARGVVVSESDVWLANSHGGGRFEFWKDKVTHWMPLPEPPCK